ncbi:MAG: nucleotidyl transferase AbiEii/AbiGii toxin family protein, partial [Candidatus Delongbacteria bacterium]|nr:nucleotidyl transferase AbiEii/AbiGii toxin family protein [Candidatus Delongbacteria bacterium]
MRLHEDNELFKQAVLAAAQFKKIPENYVEKDYWITYVLKHIFTSEFSEHAVFKGGTSLEKCYNLINRFSEDIDIIVVRNDGESDAQLTKKIRNISKMVSKILPEVEIEKITNKKGRIRKTAHNYNKLYDGEFGQVRNNIILEVTWFGNAEPHIDKNVSCYIEEMMREKGQIEYIERFELKPFAVQTLSVNRTFCEKIMSLVRFSRQDKPYEDLGFKVRHIYDLYMMLKDKGINSFFKSEEFDLMVQTVGSEDMISFNNNNEWLNEHPSKAIIFDDPESTWERIKAPYNET